jgi:hypothetical protein
MRLAAAAFPLLLAFAAQVQAEEIVGAAYSEPTTRYNHGVLGDAEEWGALRLTLSDGQERLFRLPPERVFEDTAPRLADLDGDGSPEVIVVETHVDRGAQLAIYDAAGKRAATPHIGQSHRWLAPVGAADLDGDGYVEIAYVDRPHLLKTLKVLRYKNGELVPLTEARGLTNHRIGDSAIHGGIRNCGGAGPEIVLASGDIRRIIALRLQGGTLRPRDLGPLDALPEISRALAC